MRVTLRTMLEPKWGKDGVQVEIEPCIQNQECRESKEAFLWQVSDLIKVRRMSMGVGYPCARTPKQNEEAS